MMNEPIRILHVFGKLNRGGAETMIMNIYRKINRDKIQFDFVVHTLEHCDYEDEIYNLGGRIFRVPHFWGGNYFRYKKSWNNLLLSISNIAIMHTHVRSTASIYLPLAKKMNKLTISHSHNTSSGKGISAIAKDFLQKNIIKNADYLFACSEDSGKWLFGDKMIPNVNFHVLYNSINPQNFKFSSTIRNMKREELGIVDKFVIGNIGRFSTQKNHNFLIDIFHHIQKLKPNSVLLLIGEGKLKTRIMKKVDRLKLSEKVIFTGVRTDIPELLMSLDAFVFPSLFEGLPVTLIEAQATGVKCFISCNITDDVVLIDSLINKISINDKASVWANNIISTNDYFDREKAYLHLVGDVYDINYNIKWLQEFYLSIVNPIVFKDIQNE